MKRIEDISQLKSGDKIVNFYLQNFRVYEYLMPHPHNQKILLLLDLLTDRVEQYHIETIINDVFYKDMTLDEIDDELINIHLKMIDQIKKIKENRNKKN